MSSVIIFYEHKARELESVLLLSKELKKNGVNVSIYSYIFEYYEALSFMKKHPADLIVLPWLYTYRSYSMIVPFAKINRNCVFVNLHHEQISSDAILSSVMPRHDLAKNNLYHFAWSNNFKKQLMSYGVAENTIFVDGIGRLDDAFLHRNDNNYKEKFANEFGLDKTKKWILYCETRDWVWENKGYEKFLKDNYGEKIASEYKDDQEKSLHATLNDFAKLDDSFFDTYELIYRPHPGIVYVPDLNKKIRIISKYSIYDWFTCIDANVVSYSTAAYESEAFGIPTFIDGSMKMNPKFALDGFDKYPHLSTISDITNGLSKYNCSSKTYEEYIGIVDGNATKRIADHIIKLMNDKEAIKPEIIKIDMKKHYLKMIREGIMKVMFKTNLVKIFKWPRIEYGLYRDVPYGDNPKLHI